MIFHLEALTIVVIGLILPWLTERFRHANGLMWFLNKVGTVLFLAIGAGIELCYWVLASFKSR